MGCINIKQLRAMAIEQYIVRELKEDIKLLIKKVTELEKKIDELKPVEKVYTLSHNASGDVYTESKPERIDDTFERYAGYREWNKTHDSYKILYSPYGNKT